MALNPAVPKIGPAWILIQRLDATYLPVDAAAVNLLYNKNVKTTFKPKQYKIEPHNAAIAIKTLNIGLEEASVKCDLISQNADILRICLAEGSASLTAGGAGVPAILNITGMGAPENFRVFVIYPDLIANVGVSIFSAIEDGLDLIIDYFEFRVASLGGDAVTRDADPGKESMLSFVANAMVQPGITAIPAKAKEGYTLAGALAANLDSATAADVNAICDALGMFAGGV